ncbi:MAG: hypothetical protein R3Y22_02455 [Bacteroidales bacterium]
MNRVFLRYCLVFSFLTIGGLLSYGQEHFKRDLEQVAFVPEGQWIVGLTANYSQSEQDNYQFLIIEDILGDTYSYKVTPMLCYIFKDNLGAGGRVGYSRGLTRLDNVTVALDPDMILDVDNFYLLSHNISTMGIFRNYISLGSQKRFGLYNEVQLEYSFGQSKIASGAGEAFTGTFQETHSVGLALSPGIVMFLNNELAFEISVGVLGFGYTYTKQINNQIYVAESNMTSANFKINLLSIGFGIAFYL